MALLTQFQRVEKKAESQIHLKLGTVLFSSSVNIKNYHHHLIMTHLPIILIQEQTDPQKYYQKPNDQDPKLPNAKRLHHITSHACCHANHRCAWICEIFWYNHMRSRDIQFHCHVI